MGLIKACNSIDAAIDQVKHYKALALHVTYPDTETGKQQKKKNVALLFRAMIVLETLKISENNIKENENETDKAS